MQRGTDLETHCSKWEVFRKSLPLLLREWGMPLKKWKEYKGQGGMEKIRQRKPSESTKKSSPTSETGAAGTRPA